MTKEQKHGTLSTRGNADKNKKRRPKEEYVVERIQHLLNQNRVRIHPHANLRMAERGILYFEILQALANGRHERRRDRYDEVNDNWQYCIAGKSVDDKKLRVGITFATRKLSIEYLLVITVIDLNRGE